MKTNRMWHLGVAVALCCSPVLAQAPGGGSGSGGSGQTGAGQTGAQSPSSQPGGMNSPSATQDQQMGGAGGMNAGAGADKAFVKKALGGSMAEVQMGQLALEKSSDDQVKQFAQKMVDDHGKMIEQMKPAAQQMGVEVPSTPPKNAMKSMDKMKGLSGDAFDQAYIKDMVKDHKKDSAEFKQEASTTQNPQLKELVTQGSQVIDGHLQMIQQIAQTKGSKAKM
jgi:putative membrane protein